MSDQVTIGVIGDYDGRPTHVATNDALHHAADALQIPIDVRWLPTLPLLDPDSDRGLLACDALWASPGSPYVSMEGALAGITFARERDLPFYGT